VRPLEGIRILDATRLVSGPVCCWFLAALGAEVIRVDPPGGDPTWQTLPLTGADGTHRGAPRPGDIGSSALRKGRGKRSIVLDLKNAAGRDTFRRLAKACDVLVENSVPGTMEKLGLDHASLSKDHPELVYCSITGYGHDGPYVERSAMDLVVQAVSGLMSKTGFPDGPPTKVGATVGDQVPALFAALGILAALRQRDRDGRGQYVDVAMLDSLVTLLWDEPLDDYERRGIPERYGNGDPRGAPLGVFETRDGFAAMVMTSQEQWERLVAHMERPDLLERYASPRDRLADLDAVNAIVADWCRTRTTDDVVARCVSLGIPIGPVQSAWAARTDPHVAHRGALERLRHPEADEPTSMLAPVLPLRLSRADTSTAPTEVLGASTEPVLRALLDADDDEIARLREAGAFGV
jgi:formyl-CoA transferase